MAKAIAFHAKKRVTVFYARRRLCIVLMQRRGSMATLPGSLSPSCDRIQQLGGMLFLWYSWVMYASKKKEPHDMRKLESKISPNENAYSAEMLSFYCLSIYPADLTKIFDYIGADNLGLDNDDDFQNTPT